MRSPPPAATGSRSSRRGSRISAPPRINTRITYLIDHPNKCTAGGHMICYLNNKPRLGPRAGRLCVGRCLCDHGEAAPAWGAPLLPFAKKSGKAEKNNFWGPKTPDRGDQIVVGKCPMAVLFGPGTRFSTPNRPPTFAAPPPWGGEEGPYVFPAMGPVPIAKHAPRAGSAALWARTGYISWPRP